MMYSEADTTEEDQQEHQSSKQQSQEQIILITQQKQTHKTSPVTFIPSTPRPFYHAVPASPHNHQQVPHNYITYLSPQPPQPPKLPASQANNNYVQFIQSTTNNPNALLLVSPSPSTYAPPHHNYKKPIKLRAHSTPATRPTPTKQFIYQIDGDHFASTPEPPQTTIKNKKLSKSAAVSPSHTVNQQQTIYKEEPQSYVTTSKPPQQQQAPNKLSNYQQYYDNIE